jgi:hypothetical protein
MQGTAAASPFGGLEIPPEGTLSTVQNVVLDYMYETETNSASGHNDLNVDSIHFHPNYVLVRDSTGQTTLLAVNRLRRFSYRPSTDSP